MYHMTRVYDTAENAERTIRRLQSVGFTDDMIHATAPAPREHGWTVTVEFPFGMGRTVEDILDRFNPISATAGASHQGNAGVHATAFGHGARHSREPGLEAISQLSQPKPVGAIREFSAPKSPGSISRLSGRVSAGAVAKLSRRVSPGAISRLSQPKPVGSIATLSRPRGSASIARLSAGWQLSSLFGIPLLTRSQAPVEPDSTLLVDTKRQSRR
jgi:hypothetical protein